MVSTTPQETPFFQALVDPARPKIQSGTVALIVAHPDDETVGLGAQLSRICDLTVFIVTDGAPRNMEDATQHGFSTAAAYADTRRRETLTALAVTGVEHDQIVFLGIPDQDAAHDLVGLTLRLADILPRFDVVLTHPYEGGHPDHDATAFAVHTACALMRTRQQAPPEVIEMAFYHATDGSWALQTFPDDGGGRGTLLTLQPDERWLKRCMMNAHVTQRRVLSLFSDTIERVRMAPDYDFGRLPNYGALLYEKFAWGTTGASWLQATHAALEHLKLTDPPMKATGT